MRLFNVTLLKTTSGCTLEAFVTDKNHRKPVSLWYSVPAHMASYVRVSADAFMPVVLLQAMVNNENLKVDAPVSEKLLENLHDVQTLLNQWDGKGVWPTMNIINVDVNAANIIYNDQPTHKMRPNKAVFFSLGVDSLYTLLDSIKKGEPHLTHLVLVKGFDIALDNNELFNKVVEPSVKIVKELNRKLVIVQTNIRQYMEKNIGWEAAHGGALAGVGHFLSQEISTVYINSEDASMSFYPYGSHPDLDPLWSSENIQIGTYGLGVKRSQKTIAIKDSIIAQKYLRVCWKNPDNMYNCSQCPKCIRTLCQLEAAGVLTKFSTFNHHIPLIRVATMIEPEHRLFLWHELLRTLPLNHIRLRFALIVMLVRSHVLLLMKLF